MIATAITRAKASIEDALVASGLLKGTTLTVAEIVSATDPVFWFVFVSSKDASEKEIYLTYNIIGTPAVAFGDGETMGREVQITLSLFTRKHIVDDLILAINTELENRLWDFEFNNVYWDDSNKMFTYSFTSKAQVFDLT